MLRGWRWRLGLTGPGFNTEALARGQPEGTEEHGVTGVKLSDADAWMVETGASGVQSESTISHLIFDISDAEFGSGCRLPVRLITSAATLSSGLGTRCFRS